MSNISIETLINAKKQYIIDHIMPSDLDSDIKEGLKKKEQLIKDTTEDQIRSLNPNIDDLIKSLNDQNISSEQYSKYLNNDTTQVTVYPTPDPVTTSIQYCIINKKGDEITSTSKLYDYIENEDITLELPSEVYDAFLEQYSGDDLNSYTYRMIQVGYTTDTENESGEMISGDMAEKKEYMNAIVENIKNGTPFEEAAESGDTRLIYIGNGIQIAKIHYFGICHFKEILTLKKGRFLRVLKIPHNDAIF